MAKSEQGTFAIAYLEKGSYKDTRKVGIAQKNGTILEVELKDNFSAFIRMANIYDEQTLTKYIAEMNAQEIRNRKSV